MPTAMLTALGLVGVAVASVSVVRALPPLLALMRARRTTPSHLRRETELRRAYWRAMRGFWVGCAIIVVVIAAVAMRV